MVAMNLETVWEKFLFSGQDIVLKSYNIPRFNTFSLVISNKDWSSSSDSYNSPWSQKNRFWKVSNKNLILTRTLDSTPWCSTQFHLHYSINPWEFKCCAIVNGEFCNTALALIKALEEMPRHCVGHPNTQNNNFLLGSENRKVPPPPESAQKPIQSISCNVCLYDKCGWHPGNGASQWTIDLRSKGVLQTWIMSQPSRPAVV